MNKTEIKLECEIDQLKNIITALNNRIGVENVESGDDSDNSDIGPSYTTFVNTRHFHRDGAFGKKYFYITNVSFQSKFL